MDVSVVSFLMLIATFGLFWFGILGLRPAVARASLQREVAAIRADIVDAIFDGHLPLDQPAAEDLIAWCDNLISRPRRYSLGAALAIMHACDKHGIELSPTQGPRGVHEVPAEGRKVLFSSRARLDKVVGRYLVQSSPLWPVLTPVYWILERVASSGMSPSKSTNHRAAISKSNPTVVAKELRKASSEDRPSEQQGLFGGMLAPGSHGFAH